MILPNVCRWFLLVLLMKGIAVNCHYRGHYNPHVWGRKFLHVLGYPKPRLNTCRGCPANRCKVHTLTDVQHMFNGLFMSKSDIAKLQSGRPVSEMSTQQNNTFEMILENPMVIDAGNELDPSLNMNGIPGKGQTNRRKRQLRGNSISSLPAARGGQCCQTQIKYQVYRKVKVDDKEFDVINFSSAYQYVPIGQCVNGTGCPGGICMQVMRHHWLLVVDSSEGPLSIKFEPVEVPSHCECRNIG